MTERAVEFRRVRVDPVVLQVRAYATPVDVDLPLGEMTLDYIAVATVTVMGDTAHVSALHGDEMDRAMKRDFMAEMARRGITRICWSRQQPGRIRRVEQDLQAENIS